MKKKLMTEKDIQSKEISKIKDYDLCIEYARSKRLSCWVYGATLSNIATRFKKDKILIYKAIV